MVSAREKLNIFVIAVHPDDEIFGCGGTIENHLADINQNVVYTYYWSYLNIAYRITHQDLSG